MAVFIFLAHLFMSEHPVIGKVAIDFSIPKSESVDGLIMIADDRHIIGHGHHSHCVFVYEFERAIGLWLHVGVAIEFDVDRLIRLPVLPSESKNFSPLTKGISKLISTKSAPLCSNIFMPSAALCAVVI